MPKDDLLGPRNEGLEAAEDVELRAALAAVEAARERPYYDEPPDRQERELFYQGIDPAAGGVELYLALSELLEHSHGPRLT